MSVNVTAPVLVPVVEGLKVTLTVQDAPPATLEPHVFVSEKSPVAVMLVTASVAVPVFMRVMV